MTNEQEIRRNQERLRELAKQARKAAKVQYLREKEMEKKVGKEVNDEVDTALIYSVSHVATSILADAKEAVAHGSKQKALDWMNKVSMLLIDIQSLTHTSPRHREYGKAQVEEAFEEIEVNPNEIW